MDKNEVSGKNWPRPDVQEPISVLMPVYNEHEVMETVAATFAEVVLRHLPDGSEFVIKDGGSTDGTREILEDLETRWDFVRVIYDREREGIPRALKALIEGASCPWLFMVDSDGQSLATEFWRLAPLMADTDMILGRRKVRHDALYRRGGSRVFSLFAQMLFRFPFSDINAAFRLCRRDMMLDCASHYGHLSNAFYAESTIWAYSLGYRLRQVDVMFGPRLYGTSHAFPEGTQITQFVRSFKEVYQLSRTISKLRAEGQLKAATTPKT